MSRKAPGFWWVDPDHPSGPLKLLSRALLYPASFLYGWVSGNRMRAEGYRANYPVICVGNFVAGGAGKTPLALYLAEHLKREGLRTAFLSRGYGGSLSSSQVRVDPDEHNAAQVGDEPLLLARSAPTYIGANRTAALKLVDSDDVDIVIMDDGFQNPSVGKDLSIIVVDAASGVGNGMCHPAGPLRVPLAQQVSMADMVVVIGQGRAANEVVRMAARSGTPLFFAELTVSIGEMMRDRPVFAYCGIGRPEKFQRSLEKAGVDMVGFAPFGDHHTYSSSDATKLLARARDLSAALVTTEKDMVRLKGGKGPVADLAEVSTALPAVLTFEDPKPFHAALRRTVETWRRDRLLITMD